MKLRTAIPSSKIWEGPRLWYRAVHVPKRWLEVVVFSQSPRLPKSKLGLLTNNRATEHRDISPAKVEVNRDPQPNHHASCWHEQSIMSCSSVGYVKTSNEANDTPQTHWLQTMGGLEKSPIVAHTNQLWGVSIQKVQYVVIPSAGCGHLHRPTSRSTMDPRRIGATKLLNPKKGSQKLFKIGRLIIIDHCVISKPMAWGTLILRNTHVLLAPKDFNNHSLLISSPAAICQSCRDTSPTGGKWYSFSGSAWLADGSQGPSPHVDQCGKPNHTPLLGMVYQLSIYLSIYIYIFGFTTLHTNTYKHIPTCSESFRWCVSGWKKSKVAPGIQQKPAPQTYQFIQKDLQTLPM